MGHLIYLLFGLVDDSIIAGELRLSSFQFLLLFWGLIEKRPIVHGTVLLYRLGAIDIKELVFPKKWLVQVCLLVVGFRLFQLLELP